MYNIINSERIFQCASNDQILETVKENSHPYVYMSIAQEFFLIIP